MSQKLLIDYSIPGKKYHNMNHISGQYLLTEKYPIWHQIHMKVVFLTRKAPREFNILQAPFI